MARSTELYEHRGRCGHCSARHERALEVPSSGAAAQGGIHDGDRIDLRSVSVYDRVALLFQPITTKPMKLVVARNGKSVTTRVIPSTQSDGDSATKVTVNALETLALLWALGCAWVIALRRWQTREGRYLCLALLAIVGLCVEPSNAAWPNGIVGARSALRRTLEIATVIVAAILLAGYVACTIGLLSASIAPLPFVYGTFWRLMGVAIYVIPVGATLMATVGTMQSERARAAWLLLPLPIGLLLYSAAVQLLPSATSWIAQAARSRFPVRGQPHARRGRRLSSHTHVVRSVGVATRNGAHQRESRNGNGCKCRSAQAIVIDPKTRVRYGGTDDRHPAGAALGY